MSTLLNVSPVVGYSAAAVGAVALYAASKVYEMRAQPAPGVPQNPKSHWFWGHLHEIKEEADTMWDYFADACEKWDTEHKGGVAILGPNRPPIIVLTDPQNLDYFFNTGFENFAKRHPEMEYLRTTQEIFGNGIFATDGPEWRRQRKLYSYNFSTKHLREDMYVIFEEIVDKLMVKLDKFAETGERFDLQNLFARLTIEGICAIALGQDLGAIEAEEAPPFVKAFDLTQEHAVTRSRDISWKIKKFFQLGEREKDMTKQMKVLDDFVLNVITNIRNETDSVSAGPNKNKKKRRFNIVRLALDRAKKSGTQLSDQELKDIVMAFCIAGRDTTACAMSWIMYELTQHPEIREKVMKEIGGLNGDFGYDNMSHETPYLESVFHESQRLHPSVPSDSKIALKDMTLPSGLKIKEKWLIGFHPYVFGRNKHIWGDDVLDFKPERFENGDKQWGESKYPMFNGGPRLCLGKTMAILESKYVLTRLLDRYEFSICEDTLPVNYVVSILLWIKGGLWMTAKRRDKSA